jgi:predicted NAD/FAD-binding protein
MTYSARAAMILAAKSLPANPTQPILYNVLNSGLVEALRLMVSQTSTVQVLTGATVQSIARDPQGGFTLQSADGREFAVDDLVFASQGTSALSLLVPIPGTGLQQAALRGIEFSTVRIALHTDPIYAPSNPLLWSFFNSEIEGGYCEVSMWLANVLTAPSPLTAAKLWKSWVTYRNRQPAQVLREAQFQHMVPTVATLHAQAALNVLQGAGDIWVAGGYTQRYDSQETALDSAIKTAQGMGVNSARLQALTG